VDGGGRRTEAHGTMSVPLMVREGGIIAVGKEDAKPDYEYADGVTWHMLELAEGRTVAKALHDSQGRRACEILVRREARSFTIQAKGGDKALERLPQERIRDALRQRRRSARRCQGSPCDSAGPRRHPGRAPLRGDRE